MPFHSEQFGKSDSCDFCKTKKKFLADYKKLALMNQPQECLESCELRHLVIKSACERATMCVFIKLSG